MENTNIINKVKVEKVEADKVENASAEKVLGTVAKKFFLWVGIILCVLLFKSGLGMITGDADAPVTFFMGVAVMLVAILNIILVLIVWASVKFLVNISRNIFVIKDILMSDHDNLGKR